MVQAIGSEVAAETSSSAEMNVPAMIVAVSRAEANEANIGKTPFCISLAGPTFGPTPDTMHGACQSKNI
jgi:hypothetical protein